MHVTRDLSHEVCVIRELFVFGREKFRFPEVFPIITDSITAGKVRVWIDVHLC